MEAGLLLNRVWEQWAGFTSLMQADFYSHSDIISRVVFRHRGLRDGAKSKQMADFAFSTFTMTQVKLSTFHF